MTKTLADMTAEERADCVGMWCDNLVSTADNPKPVVLACVQGERCWILHTDLHGEWSCFSLVSVSPRFDLPRAWTPDGEPVEMVKEYGIFYTLRDGDEEICFVHDSPLSVEPAVKHLEKSLRRGTITKITRKTQWVTEWEEVPEPQRTNGMVNPYV